MTMTISPEAFLATPTSDEDYELDTEPVDPLESIAESLRTLAAASAPVQYFTAERASTNDHGEEIQLLTEAHSDLQDEHIEVLQLLEDVEALVKPSTSKLANSVRAAINAWRAPEVPAEPVEDHTPAELPAADAPVEEWREFARGLTDQDVDSMNRSQIRTLLGIPHGTEDEAGE